MAKSGRWLAAAAAVGIALLAVVAGRWYLQRRADFHPAEGRTIVAPSPPAVEPGAQEWPQFRGPNRDGRSTEADWAFPESGPPRELWRKELGPGASSVAVAGGRLFTLGNVEDEDIVYALAAPTGDELWRFVYRCSRTKRQFEGGPAATPTVDGDRVYILSHEGQLFSLDAATGALRWALHVLADLGGKRPAWGFAGSPLVVGEKLVVGIGGAGSSTAALDKETGATIWKAGSDGAGYASPLRFPSPSGSGPGVDALLVFKAKALVAQALEDGRELWRYPWETSYDVNASTPIVSGDQVFVSTGYGHGCALLDISSGSPRLVWESEALRTHFGSGLLHEKHVYGPDDKGELRAIELASGKIVWRVPDFGKGTVILAGDRLIGLSESGELLVLEASPDSPVELGRAKVIPGRCWVSPALANGMLYVRNNDGLLVCLDLRA